MKTIGVLFFLAPSFMVSSSARAAEGWEPGTVYERRGILRFGGCDREQAGTAADADAASLRQGDIVVLFRVEGSDARLLTTSNRTTVRVVLPVCTGGATVLDGSAGGGALGGPSGGGAYGDRPGGGGVVEGSSGGGVVEAPSGGGPVTGSSGGGALVGISGGDVVGVGSGAQTAHGSSGGRVVDSSAGEGVTEGTSGGEVVEGTSGTGVISDVSEVSIEGGSSGGSAVAAGLRAVLKPDKTVVVEGAQLVYTLELANAGRLSIRDLRVLVSLPRGFELLEADPQAGQIKGPGQTQLTWTTAAPLPLGRRQRLTLRGIAGRPANAGGPAAPKMSLPSR